MQRPSPPDHDAEAYREARQREHDVTPVGRRDSHRPNGTALAAVALIAAKRTALALHITRKFADTGRRVWRRSELGRRLAQRLQALVHKWAQPAPPRR
jgi:hypothetical protein